MIKLKIIILSVLIVSCKAKESPIDIKADKILNAESFTFRHDIVNGCMSPVDHLVYQKSGDSIFFLLNDSVIKVRAFRNELKAEINQFIKDGLYYSAYVHGPAALYLLTSSTDTVVFFSNKREYNREFLSRFDLNPIILDSLRSVN